MNRTRYAFATATLLAVLLGACSSQSDDTDRALDEASAAASEAAAAASEAADDVEEAVDEAVDQVTAVPAVSEAPSFHTTGGYAVVLAAIITAVGPDPQLVDLTVFPDHFTFSAVNPAKPTELDEYTYVNGAMLDSRPVDYGGDEAALKANLWRALTLTPEAVGLFASEAVLLGEVDGGELQHVRVARGLPFTEDVQLVGYVTSDRDSSTVTGNLAGQVLKVS